MKFCFKIIAVLSLFYVTNGQAVKYCGYGKTGPDCDECGKRFIKSGRIMGGRQVPYNEWPSVVFIQFKYESSKNETIIKNATGTLINKRTVLASASFFYNMLETLVEAEFSNDEMNGDNFFPNKVPIFTVILGANNIRMAQNGTGEGVEITVESYTVHPDFDENTFLNDIAIIHLSSEVEYSSNIQPACLPNPAVKNYPTKYNTKIMAVGWGSTSRTGTTPNRLHKVELIYYPNSRCNKVFREVKKNWKRQMCVGFWKGGKDTCRGDTGAPLFKTEYINGTKITVVAGITSYGDECGKKRSPAIYTKVSSYLDWIESASYYDTPAPLETTTESFPFGSRLL